ncbi:sensor histidine kinase [Bradyrhizobium sp.]|uniref:sensor histidine kinase n=1 Tax=Bradyrhizobium sp. TaxID=376 RepID=UPI003C45DF0A
MRDSQVFRVRTKGDHTMLVSALRLATTGPGVSRWLLGRRTLVQFAAIIVLALAGLTLSILVTERSNDARAWVLRTREVQLAVDKVVWDLLELQQVTEAQRVSRDPNEGLRFIVIRNNIRMDIDGIVHLIADGPHQQELLARLSELSDHYLDLIDRVAASDPDSGVGRNLAPLLSADAGQISLLIGEMRRHEDALLEARSARADRLFRLLLPTLCLSAAIITLLVVMAAQSLNRVVRERDLRLSEKDRELAAKDIMMREVDHRARNSLGLVYNLMTFQQQRLGYDDTTRNLLAQAANQVLVVARVHERLYKSQACSRLPIGGYLRELCDDVAAFSLPEELRSLIGVRAITADIPAEQAIWLGLIVVEFVTNALKYAKPSAECPILIDVGFTDARLRVTVSDFGPGLPGDFDLDASQGLGMQVVGLLVKQLRGTLGVDRDWPGARFVITMPLAA